jgi:hypothetical protein
VTDRRRWLLTLLAAVLAAVAVYRVFAPTEVVAVATGAPPPAVPPPTGVVGRFGYAPLVVADRVRVYAAPRQLSADAPVTASTPRTKRWSLRRWPEQLTAVVAVGDAVVSRWSDGQLVAVDAVDGHVRWRAAGPGGGRHLGGPTGAGALWSPVGLVAGAGTVVSMGGDRAAAVDAGTGRRLWEIGCGAGFAAGARFVCAATGAVHDLASGAPVSGWPAGPVTALGCRPQAGCAGLRDRAGQGWLLTGPAPTRAAGLDDPQVVLEPAGVVALTRTPDAGLVARDPATGGLRWSRDEPGTLLAAQPGLVHLLTPRWEVVTLAAATGAVHATTLLKERPSEPLGWRPGAVHAAAGYLAVERLLPSGRPLNEAPVLLVGTGADH